MLQFFQFALLHEHNSLADLRSQFELLERCFTLNICPHATERCAQRNLTPAEIEYVLAHGKKFHNAGAIAYFLGRKDIPKADSRNQRLQQLVGTTVLVSANGAEIITVYRNQNGLKEHRQKAKYRKPRHSA